MVRSLICYVTDLFLSVFAIHDSPAEKKVCEDKGENNNSETYNV